MLSEINKSTNYLKQGKFRWAKLLWYPQYMDFRGNTSAVQGQDAILRAQDS